MTIEKSALPIVNSHNEWDPLEEVIVGTAIDARIPSQDKYFEVFGYRTLPDTISSNKRGALPEKIIAETEEDIALFINEIKKLGLTIRRPSELKNDIFKTPDWSSDSYFPYCPRDTVTVIGNTLLESPNCVRSRYYETLAYRDHFQDYMKKGARWISAPKPRLQDGLYDRDESGKIVLKNDEPIFDAANIIRAGRDIFYSVSISGNELGAQWLQSMLGDTYRVHQVRSLVSTAHIDATLVFIRPGLVLANPERINADILPEPLKQWEIIYAPEMVAYQFSDLPPIASPWLGMNILMLSESLAVVDSFQKPLIKLLEQNAVDVLPITLRHGQTLGGGPHCITLDVRRKGTLEDYF